MLALHQKIIRMHHHGHWLRIGTREHSNTSCVFTQRQMALRKTTEDDTPFAGLVLADKQTFTVQFNRLTGPTQGGTALGKIAVRIEFSINIVVSVVELLCHVFGQQEKSITFRHIAI